jgi:hypothetical protein
VRFTLIRRAGFVLFSAVITFLTPGAPADSGIAARYPGDKNIGSDPAVILADDFEGYTSPSELTAKWSNAGVQANLRIATEAGSYYAGGKALEMKLPISTTEVVNSVGKNISPEQDVLFVRSYTKFDSGFSVTTSDHNGLRVSAHYPNAAGTAPPADGTGFFLMTLQNNATDNPLPGGVQPGDN